MTPIPAATVILIRPGTSGLEAFLLRRNRKASFMSNAFVFPGGKIDPDDGSPEVAALRELFEEAGVLLCDRPLEVEKQKDWRRRLLANETSFTALLEAEKLAPDATRLHPWARWVTPSFEPKRFDAHFFVAELPPDQVPSFDAQETVEELWISPKEALARQEAGTLRLPPPQVRTFHELAAAGTVGAAVAMAAERAKQPATILPRIHNGAEGEITLVMPWDRDYLSAQGEGEPIAEGHILSVPPSRFTWTGTSWRTS